MLIPYATDAPVYHFPFSTIGLIVVNVIMFFAFCLGLAVQDAEFVEGMLLQFGNGLRPWQWLTSMFMHAGPMHLIGNMLFLWSFGLVVEGKLGNFWFVVVYLGMGLTQAALVQLLMLGSDGGAALGASGAIFAVMSLVVIFAPVNTFDVVLILFRVIAFEIPIMMFGFFYFALNTVFFFIGGAQMSSEALHLAGLLVGAPVGMYLLTQGWVDCEGYDIISCMTGKEGNESKVGQTAQTKRRKQKEESVPKKTPEEVRTLIHSQIEQAIHESNFDVAVALQKKLNSKQPDTTWQQPHLIAVIRGYLQAQRYDKAEEYMLAHIDLFPANRFSLQSKLIKIWLHAQRPRKAIRYIQSMQPEHLSEPEQQELRKYVAYAKQLIKDGVLEVE